MTARAAGAEVRELGDVRGPMDRVDGRLEALTGEVESRGGHLVAEIVTAVERRPTPPSYGAASAGRAR